MKKMSVIILVFLLLFAGCAAKGVESCPAEEPMVEVPAEEVPAAETTEGAPLAPETMPEEPEEAPQIEPEAPGTAPEEPGSLHMECGSRTIKALGGGYMAFLWFPMTPEKILTVMIAIGLLRRFFPDDEDTLAVLRDSLAKVKNSLKRKKPGVQPE